MKLLWLYRKLRPSQAALRASIAITTCDIRIVDTMRTDAGASLKMSKEWIESLARDVKQKNHEAAQKYGRDQHYAGIIDTLGKEFFVALVLELQENVDAFRRHLQGHSTAAETGVQTVKPDEIKITRARFPWVDARLVHNQDIIMLDYAKGAGVHCDPVIDRKTRTFAFKVAADDSLFVEDAFADSPRKYEQPEELARQITEVLFAA